ncbi:PTS sugar transporter subunit IIB [Spiroplasma taiwanense]|uniref:hypothetical protein n=1 Tax=Spiroplasma taiwanense TaxID=2145 RepID=UPI00041A6C07|nr:hypothetical protein [Spiroplasma taiwanense]
MNSSYIAMPWSMPTFFALPLSTGFQWESFILPLIWILISFGMYSPFLILQDSVYYKKELSQATKEKEFVDFRNGIQYLGDLFFRKKIHLEIKNKKQQLKNNLNNDEIIIETKQINKEDNSTKKTYEILVICMGAGTSAMLAETINQVFKESEYKINAKACSIENYSVYIAETDLVIISPQARSIEKDLMDLAKTQTKLTVHQTKGTEFIEMIKDKKVTYKKILEGLNLN